MNEGSTIGQPVTPWVKSGGRYSNSYSGSAFFIPFFPFSLFPFFPFSKSLIEVVGKRPCGPMPTYNGFPFYPFILLSFYRKAHRSRRMAALRALSDLPEI